MAAVLLAVAVTAVLILAVWPPWWAPEPWRRSTRRVRHAIRCRRYQGVDLKRPPLTTASFPSERSRTDVAR